MYIHYKNVKIKIKKFLVGGGGVWGLRDSTNRHKIHAYIVQDTAKTIKD